MAFRPARLVLQLLGALQQQLVHADASWDVIEAQQKDAAEPVRALKAERSPVPDELYMARLLELVEKNGGVAPSAREVARKPSVGQDRARRLIDALKSEPADDEQSGAGS